MAKLHIAILDDDASILASLKQILEADGYRVSTMQTGLDFRRARATTMFDALLLDLNLAESGESKSGSGLDVLAEVQREIEPIPTAIISGTADISMAVQALKSGAREFFEKPLQSKPILRWLHTLQTQSSRDNEYRQLLNDTLKRYELVGESSAMAQVRQKIIDLAPLKETVLVWGETGTGKELVAARLHYLSARRAKAFHAVNIASISDSLLESTLFGHGKGAFSGATEQNPGLILASDGSTLFIDEIGEMKSELQASLLRVLQDGQVMRLGAVSPTNVDVRFVFATNRELPVEVERNSFRRDLYYRISGLSVYVPPLRERTEDIPLLCNAFCQQFCSENNFPLKFPSLAALDKLAGYSFPGNVRELKSILLNVLIRTARQTGDFFDAPDIGLNGQEALAMPALVTSDEAIFKRTTDLGFAKLELEKRYIEVQLEKHEYAVAATAHALGILPANLYRKMRTLGIPIR